MKRFLSFLALIVLAPAVFAAPNFFTPATNDQSLYFLSTIFGNVGNVLHLASDATQSTLMKYTFYYFNQAVLVLGCLVILYTLIVSVINTSHSGEMLGSKWNSVWIPLRSALGFALLLPIGPGQTYAVIQAIMMWIIVQGVGAADYLWSNMVTQILNGNAKISADTASSATATDTVMGAFQSYLCAMEFVQMQSYKDYNKQNNSWGPTLYYNHKTGGGFWTKKQKVIGYGDTAPHVFFQTTDAGAVQPNTNFWTFGIMNPSSWSTNSICGSITTPASTATMVSNNPALATYYNNQRDILSMALGVLDRTGSTDWMYNPPRVSLSNGAYNLYLPNSNNTFQIQGSAPDSNSSYYYGNQAWGVYGGDWFGDYGSGSTPSARQSENDPLNGWNKGLAYMEPQLDQNGNVQRDANGNVIYQSQPTYLPTIAYLAELLAENIDAGSPAPNPTAASTTDTAQGNGATGETSYTVMTTSQIPLYVETQLALVAQAYSDATAANYAAYQSALAAQNGNVSSSGTAADIAAAAKFNGWASAGAFYLDMAQVLQATTSDIAAIKNFSYAALACSNGVGVSTEATSNNMLCQDARSPADVGGTYSTSSSHPNKAINIGTALGNAIQQSQNITMQAQGMMAMLQNYNISPSTLSADQTACQKKSIAQGHDGTYVTTPDGNKENCGIANTTGSGIFTVTNKPHFPQMVMNPLAWYKYVNQMLAYNFAVAIQPLAGLGQSGVMANPIMTLRQTGIRLLNTSAKLLHVGENYMWYSGLASMFASAWSPLPGAAMSTFTWMSSMATAMIAAMMAMGAILAYYIPLVPYLVFTFAFIQWLVLTVEAMTAAPLVALGILHPEGQHEVFGHSSMGIAFMATLFLRPSLMIIGYFAATVMCIVVVLVLNAGFFFAADSMITGDATTGSLFGCIVVWMMYTNAVIIAVTKAFSLIYHIPDHVSRWIGINEPSSDVEQMMSQVKEGVKQGGEMGSKGMDAKASAKSSTGSKVFSKGGKKE